MTWLLRKLPLIAAALAFALAFVWLDRDKQFRREQYPAYSLHNTSPQGCSLAYRYLKERRERELNGAPVSAELNRLVDPAAIERDAVIFRIDPQVVPGEVEEPTPKISTKPAPAPKIPAADPKKPLLTNGEKSWVSNGGRLVIALEGIYGPLESQHLITSGEVRKVFPIWPQLKTIEPAAARLLMGEPLNEAQTLLTLDNDIYAARFSIGKGDVIVFAAADIFSNEHLAAGSRLQLLTAQLPPGRAFYFDEYVHHLQTTTGVFELLGRWGFNLALLVGGALALGAFWRARVPLGPPEDPFRETRSQAVDFVGSLAPLYERSLSREQALAMHYKNFLQSVSAQSGLRGDSLAAKIRALLTTANAGRAPDELALTGQRELDRAQFERWLRVINTAWTASQHSSHSKGV